MLNPDIYIDDVPNLLGVRQNYHTSRWFSLNHNKQM